MRVMGILSENCSLNVVIPSNGFNESARGYSVGDLGQRIAFYCSAKKKNSGIAANSSGFCRKSFFGPKASDISRNLRPVILLARNHIDTPPQMP